MITIKLNDRSPYVQYARLALLRMGIQTNESNDLFDNDLYDKIINLQTLNGITADGIVSQSTWNILLEYLKGYTTETIRPATTFFLLAKKYNTTVKAIEIANPTLEENNLPIGETIIIPYNFFVVSTNVFYTYEYSRILIDGLNKRYPFIGAESAGQSVMGRELSYLTIGTGTTQVFYNASHHANEWITTPVLFKFLEDYANAYAYGNDIEGLDTRRLYSTKRLSLIPLVNPDGVDLVNGVIPKNSTFYKDAKRISDNFPNIPFPNGWKANIIGTDLNLNYPAGWENAKEIKFSQGYTMPAPRDYVGVSPLSTPESESIYRFTLKNNFDLTLSYHSQGKVIYWKYLDYNPPRALEIGRELSRVSGYSLDETPRESGYAGYKDWYIFYYNRPGYTIEVGEGNNPLPLSQFDEIYRANFPLMVKALELA